MNPTKEAQNKILERIQFFPESILVEDLALFSDLARYNARIAETTVYFILSTAVKKINPIELNKIILKNKWPASFGVLCEQAIEINKIKLKISDESLSSWVSKAIEGVCQNKEKEIYFIGYFKPGSKTEKWEIDEAIACYTKWGFYGKDLLINV